MKYGDPRLPPEFWQRVCVNPDRTWTWTGALTDKGYGTFRRKLAHRWLFLASGQEVPKGWHVGHTCHDEAVLAGTCQGGACEHRRCVTLSCLAAQTPRENIRAGMAPSGQHSRQTVCQVCGGPFTVIKRGERRCIPCDRRRTKEAETLCAQAAKHLGMGWREYRDTFGVSTRKAQELLTRPA